MVRLLIMMILFIINNILFTNDLSKLFDYKNFYDEIYILTNKNIYTEINSFINITNINYSFK